ncbi:NADH-quinone oxidoreductase subunit B family protein [Pyrococcus kukulkanii]|uniref:NADH-quinone oxidoreductase subunit B family protein n=1 Tax=Pyrococcus kukulkanii TaxID=1609559 RepID=UPI003569F6AB
MRYKSVWVFHVDSGSCNGCDIEILDVLTPYYDVERFGIKLVGSPRHADALLVSGPLTRQTYYAVKAVYEAMPPKPRIVVAIGTCASSGGIFYNGYPIYNPTKDRGRDRLRTGGIEVLLQEYGTKPDLYIPGCPPSPEEILYGLSLLLGIKEKKMKGERWTASPPGREEGVPFRLPVRPVNERIYLTLREELRRVIGYFDRKLVLEEFLRMVEEAEKSENPRETLHSLIQGFLKKERDCRIRFAMQFLEKEYWRIRDEYERRHVGLVKVEVP